MSNVTTTFRSFPSQSAFILGNGPSLAQYDPFDLRRRITIGMNRSLDHCPSDIYCFISGQGWGHQLQERKQRVGLEPRWVFYQGLHLDNEFLQLLNEVGKPHPIRQPNWYLIESTQNTHPWSLPWHGLIQYDVLFLTLYVAFWLGFKEVYLLGIDMDTEQGYFDGTDAEKRCLKAFPNAPTWQRNRWNISLGSLVKKSLKGMDIWNCNRYSKLECFPYMPASWAWDRTSTKIM